jgi:hypothetical protein
MMKCSSSLPPGSEQKNKAYETQYLHMDGWARLAGAPDGRNGARRLLNSSFDWLKWDRPCFGAEGTAR